MDKPIEANEILQMVQLINTQLLDHNRSLLRAYATKSEMLQMLQNSSGNTPAQEAINLSDNILTRLNLELPRIINDVEMIKQAIDSPSFQSLDQHTQGRINHFLQEITKKINQRDEITADNNPSAGVAHNTSSQTTPPSPSTTSSAHSQERKSLDQHIKRRGGNTNSTQPLELEQKTAERMARIPQSQPQKLEEPEEHPTSRKSVLVISRRRRNKGSDSSSPISSDSSQHKSITRTGRGGGAKTPSGQDTTTGGDAFNAVNRATAALRAARRLKALTQLKEAEQPTPEQKAANEAAAQEAAARAAERVAQRRPHDHGPGCGHGKAAARAAGHTRRRSLEDISEAIEAMKKIGETLDQANAHDAKAVPDEPMNDEAKRPDAKR